MDRIVRLAVHLPNEDADLIRSIYDRGLTAAELARLSNRPARTMQRRVRGLVMRIASPLFEFVVCHRRRWPELRRDVGEHVIVRGTSMRSTSKLLGVSLHQVRRELDRIRAEAEAREERTEVRGQRSEDRSLGSVGEAGSS